MFLIISSGTIDQFLNWCNENELTYIQLPDNADELTATTCDDVFYSKCYHTPEKPAAYTLEYHTHIATTEAKVLAKLSFTLPDTDLDMMFLHPDNFS